MTETKAESNRFIFNEENVKAVPFAQPGEQKTYHATNMQGLALRVGATTKTFIIYARVSKGAPTRVSLGKYGYITVAQAIKKAKEVMPQLVNGIDINKEKKVAKQKSEEQAQGIATTKVETLGWLLDKYRDEHIKGNKGGSEATLKDIALVYTYFAEKQVQTLKKKSDDTWDIGNVVILSDWLSRPYREIKRQEVLDRFNIFSVALPSRVSRSGIKPIVRTHQLCFKFASSAYNYIIGQKDEDEEGAFRNPFNILSAHKKWKKTGVKDNYVDFNKFEFYKWWNAVLNYGKASGSVSDYILFSLLQASRSIDAASLKWSAVDFDGNKVIYKETKNNEVYVFPMTKMVREILERRKRLNENGIFVFEYPASKLGHVPPACKPHFKNISTISGKLITHHDLRRTWATAARKLKTDKRTIDYCLKHTINDVNIHYFVENEQEILEAFQSVEDFFVAQVSVFHERIYGNKTVSEINEENVVKELA